MSTDRDEEKVNQTAGNRHPAADGEREESWNDGQ
jgi:hypothetical protein